MTMRNRASITRPNGRGALANSFGRRNTKTLVWTGVNMTITAKGKSPGKKILDNVWGEARNEVTAILGPSGAGKSSLLNVLSGRIRTDGRHFEVKADVRLDGRQVDPTNITTRHQIAFVAQDDSLHVSSTPRESISFSAKLRLPRFTTDEEITVVTNHMLKELGLEGCADTIVGGEMLHGISGGERKRTSVGVELVTKPSIIFLDEPTSGLDSFNALQLSNILKTIANAGASVLLTIHQPTSEVFASFDRLILMNQGRVMYQGTLEEVPDYFASRGHPLLPMYNPADWMMMIAQTETMEKLELAGYFSSDCREVRELVSELPDAHAANIHVGIFTEVKVLLVRDFNSICRNPLVLGARMMFTGFIAVLSGLVYWQIGGSDPNDPLNLQSRFGAAVFALVGAVFGTSFPSLSVFPQERPVFLREYTTNHYSVTSYFLSRLLLEGFQTVAQMFTLSIIIHFMVDFQLHFGYQFVIYFALAMTSTAFAMFVGSSVEDPKLALEFLPVATVPQIMFTGFFIATSLIPRWLRWLQYIMPLTYATRLFLEREFHSCGYRCDALLQSVEVKSTEVYWYWMALVGIFVLARIGALVMLVQKSRKYF